MPDSAYHQDPRHRRPPAADDLADAVRPGDAAERHRRARAEREAADWPALPDHRDPLRDDPIQEEAPAPPPHGDAPPPERSDSGGTMRLIAACGLAGAVAGGLAALSLPQRYDATAELRLDGGPAPLAGIDDQIRVAASGLVLNKVVDRLGLADDPDFNGAAGDGGPLAFVRALLLRHDGGADADAGQRHSAAAGRLAASLAIGRGGAPQTVAVTARTGDGEKSALIANTVAEALLETAATLTPAQPAKVARPGQDESAARRLEVFLASHGLGSADPQAAAGTLLKLDEQLAAARARTAGLNGKIAAMRALDADSAVGGGLPQEFESGAMGDLRAQYLAIKRERDKAAARLGPRNPELIALDTQLAGARERIAAELRRIGAALQGELKVAVQAEQGLSARLAETKLGPDDIAALRALDEAASREAERLDDISTASTGATAAPAATLTRAYAPLEPSGPPRLAIALSGLLIGLGAGTGLAALRGTRSRPAGTGPEAEPAEAVLIDPIDPTDADETPCPPETAMHPVYSDPYAPFAPQQAGEHPQQLMPPAPQPQHYAPMPMHPPAPPVAAPWFYAPYPPVQHWQHQPLPAGYYPYPHPAWTPHADAWSRPMPLPAASAMPSHALQEADPATLEEIRASLRECREAVRELAESRARRSY